MLLYYRITVIIFLFEMVKKNSHLGKFWLYSATALGFSVGFLLLEMFRFIFVCVLSYAAKKTVSNRTNCLVLGRRSGLESENSFATWRDIHKRAKL